MNNDNKTTRELAIEWWGGLTENTKRELAKKHFPGDIKETCAACVAQASQLTLDGLLSGQDLAAQQYLITN